MSSLFLIHASTSPQSQLISRKAADIRNDLGGVGGFYSVTMPDRCGLERKAAVPQRVKTSRGFRRGALTMTATTKPSPAETMATKRDRHSNSQIPYGSSAWTPETQVDQRQLCHHIQIKKAVTKDQHYSNLKYKNIK